MLTQVFSGCRYRLQLALKSLSLGGKSAELSRKVCQPLACARKCRLPAEGRDHVCEATAEPVGPRIICHAGLRRPGDLLQIEREIGRRLRYRQRTRSSAPKNVCVVPRLPMGIVRLLLVREKQRYLCPF
jgi:hypothetical protein